VNMISARHIIKSLVLLLLLIPVAACAGWGPAGGMSQGEIKQLESRLIDGPFERVYEAAVETLFDLGYTVSHSDKESGIIVGEKQKQRLLLLSEQAAGAREFDAFQVTLLVRPKGKKQTKVRIKTARNKKNRFNKNAVNKVWNHLENEIMLERAAQ
jgi:hypothetical protein